MRETTKQQLVSAASRLLDGGGQDAVTLRAVAEQVGVSHNAPYRHFSGRSALLAAVAERDFTLLRQAFEAQDEAHHDAAAALRGASDALIAYALDHRARYRLLFSDPDLVAEASLRQTAFGAFTAFSRIVARCQQSRHLPRVDPVELTGLIYAALHGAIDLHIGGRASDTKGLASVQATVQLLFDLLNGAASAASG